MRRALTNDGPGNNSEFERILFETKHSLWRWEQQPAYWIGTEQAQFDAFRAGYPEPPTEIRTCVGGTPSSTA